MAGIRWLWIKYIAKAKGTSGTFQASGTPGSLTLSGTVNIKYNQQDKKALTLQASGDVIIADL